MKVLLINGSPNEKGCTYTALNIIAGELQAQGIQTEIFHIKDEPISGCSGCGYCRKSGTYRCVRADDSVNEALPKMAEADALVIGTPVYFASPNGSLLAFLDRFFYAGGECFSYKPACCIASARRGGTTASLDVINKYFGINCMPIVTSQYWNMVHGSKPEDVLKDEEGVQTMRMLGKNMAWLLLSLAAAKSAGVALPTKETKIKTNFIK